jgi:hypothetical protein
MALTVGYPRHNHDPFTGLSAHPALRKIEKDKAFKATIKAQKQAGMQVNHIYASIHGQDSESLIIKHDIYNERANVCRDKLGGLFPIYALFRFVLISDKAHKEFTSAFECENGDKGGPLKYLFVMHNKHIVVGRCGPSWSRPFSAP